MPYKDKAEKNKRQKERTRKRRAKYFSGKACTRCGSTNEMVVHHLNPSEKVDHKVWSWSESRRSAEAIAATAVFLFLFGWAFNQLINYLHRRGLNDGFVWLEVVVGDAAVLLAAGFTLGWGASLLLFIYFAAGGFWMAVGDIWRHVRARQLEAQEREL